MRSVISTITTKGQVTIPAEVRRHLGVASHDQVAFVIDGDRVSLEPVAFNLESAFGSVKPTTRPEDFDALIIKAKTERGKGLLAKLRGT